jgi:hypothetical protein
MLSDRVCIDLIVNRKGHRETLVRRQPGNLNAATHGAYSMGLKAPRVAEVLEELQLEHPHEAIANLRALAELYITAERLSEWVASREDGGISASGKITPAVLEARKAWSIYLDKARELGITCRGRREVAALPDDRPQPTSQLTRHLRGEDDER